MSQKTGTDSDYSWRVNNEETKRPDVSLHDRNPRNWHGSWKDGVLEVCPENKTEDTKVKCQKGRFVNIEDKETDLGT